MEQETHSITCPHCWQILEILIDPSAGDQEYTEDCQVCCHPMQITVHCDGLSPTDVTVEPE